MTSGSGGGGAVNGYRLYININKYKNYILLYIICIIHNWECVCRHIFMDIIYIKTYFIKRSKFTLFIKASI